MEVFERVFKKDGLNKILFISVKSASEYKDVFEFKELAPDLFKQWEMICKIKYKIEQGINDEQSYMLMLNDAYTDKAYFYPEFSKIIGFSYGTADAVNDTIERKIFRVFNVDEVTILEKILVMFAEMNVHFLKKINSNPTICGHNILAGDIPLIMKRLIKYREKLGSSNLIPEMLKKQMSCKPWDSNVIDTLNVWKFNGISNTPLPVIANFLGLKTATDIMDGSDLSKYYWKNITTVPDEVEKVVGLQSANQVNVLVQLINELRTL